VAKSDHLGAFATAVAAALAAVDDITSQLLVPIMNVSVGGVGVHFFLAYSRLCWLKQELLAAL
jgi:hypothetical protein